MAVREGGVVNIVVAGLGGQGVLKAADIVAQAAFRAGLDVKKSEVHGMSQRGGSVQSDVRFGPKVESPMVPVGEGDFLIALAPEGLEASRPFLKAGGVLIERDRICEDRLPNRRSLNLALLGVLSTYLGIPEAAWRGAIEDALPGKVLDANLRAFALGRELPEKESRAEGTGR
jgi:indolepyruvate ferredoxin oxidoreductase, beta subunit